MRVVRGWIAGLAVALGSESVLYVDADLTSKAQPAPPMVVTSADLTPAEQALGTDSYAWLPLILWLGGLLIGVGLLSWLRQQWGRWQTWVVAVPVFGFFGLAVADQVARLLPNLM